MARTPIHPGEILKDELEELKISGSALAARLHVPAYIKRGQIYFIFVKLVCVWY
jgi:hypothetical protein